jgi:hypothetical protein
MTKFFLSPAVLTPKAGTGISIANGPGTFTISATGGGGGSGTNLVVLEKPIDQSITSSTSLTADTILTYNLATDSQYHYRFRLFVNNADSVAGFQVGLNGTVGMSNLVAQVMVATASFITFTDVGRITAFNTGLPVIASGSGLAIVEIDGTIDTSTAGTFYLEFAQNTSSANAVTVQHGSTLELELVGVGTLGSGVLTGPTSSLPTPGVAGRIYFPTDGGEIYEDNGISWQAFGPINLLTIPVLSNFTQVNSGGEVTYTQSTNGIYLVNSDDSGNIRSLVVSTPGVPYTVTAGFIPLVWDIEFNMYGLVIRNSGSGNVIVMRNVLTNPYLELDIYPATDGGSYGSAYLADVGLTQNILWMRFSYDGTNRHWYISQDGVNFLQVLTQAGGTYITENQVGIFTTNFQASKPLPSTLISWTLTTP